MVGDFTLKALEEKGKQPDLKTLSLEAGVPLRQLQEGVKIVQKRVHKGDNKFGQVVCLGVLTPGYHNNKYNQKVYAER